MSLLSKISDSDHINTIVTKAYQIREPLVFYIVLNRKNPVRCFVLSQPMSDRFWSIIPLWSPWRYTCTCLIDKLESVQREFTKRLKGFGHISCAERLNRLNTETLELRRLKSDRTLMFCIIGPYLVLSTSFVIVFSLSFIVTSLVLVITI